MFIFVYDWLVVGEGLILISKDSNNYTLIRSFAGLQDPRVGQSFYKKRRYL